MVVLSHRKKILISLPDTLLTEFDTMATAKKINRSKLIREAMKRYIKEQKHASLTASLKKGYEQMADINLEIAEFSLEADNIQQQSYEEKLAECE